MSVQRFTVSATLTASGEWKCIAVGWRSDHRPAWTRALPASGLPIESARDVLTELASALLAVVDEEVDSRP
uniref:Uncharacterized protein n=1 Tax=uncultured prokaryote TaxID=198431 RepID=A0A0H5Q438_9ZZZZ|nr:hypothetical protein [uncultured prokaryote]